MAYNFCPNCSKKITKKSKSLYICSYCGLHFYENPRPTNALILENEKEEILLVKRKSPPKRGYWDLPGGFVNTRESMEQAIRREIKEELGINLNNFHYLFSLPDRYLYKGLNYYILGFFFRIKMKRPKIFPRDDIIEARFFTKDKIPFGKIAFENIKIGLKRYLSSFQQSPGSKQGK